MAPGSGKYVSDNYRLMQAKRKNSFHMGRPVPHRTFRIQMSRVSGLPRAAEIWETANRLCHR